MLRVVVISVALFHTVHLTTNFTIPANEKGLDICSYLNIYENLCESAWETFAGVLMVGGIKDLENKSATVPTYKAAQLLMANGDYCNRNPNMWLFYSDVRRRSNSKILLSKCFKGESCYLDFPLKAGLAAGLLLHNGVDKIANCFGFNNTKIVSGSITQWS